MTIAMTRKFLNNNKLVLVLGLLGIALIVYWVAVPGKRIDYSADVKPIFNKKCISCHGGVTAKGGFSLLFEEEALGNTESGKPAIIPGDPDGSEMIRRLTIKDPEERMPYKHEPLSKEEIDILKKWIRQGAKWGDHWAYLPVTETQLPETKTSWGNNNIDAFILAKLEEVKKWHQSGAQLDEYSVTFLLF